MLSENVVFIIRQFFRREIRHVLHQPQYRDLYGFLLEHSHPFAGIGKRNGLGGTHHNRTGNRQGLHNAQVNIPGARGQVNK